MANSLFGLLSLAIVVAVRDPTVASLGVSQLTRLDLQNEHLQQSASYNAMYVRLLSEGQLRTLNSVWDILIPMSLNDVALKAAGENSLHPHFIAELDAWFDAARLLYIFKDSKNAEMDVATALVNRFDGDQKLYESLKSAETTTNNKLQKILAQIEKGLFAMWGHSEVEVKQVFEYIKSDFNYDSLDVNEAADKLFKNPSLRKLIAYAGGKDKPQSFSSVAAVLADHFTPEKLSRMIESAKRTPRHDDMVDKLENGLRDYSEKKMSSAVENNGDVVDLVPSLHSKNAESPSAVITPASFTPESSTISLLPTAPLSNANTPQALVSEASKPIASSTSESSSVSPHPNAPLTNANKQQVLVNDALNPSLKPELESGLLFEPSVAKTQPLLSRDDVVASVKSTPALPPSNNPPSESLLARFRRWLSALWA